MNNKSNPIVQSPRPSLPSAPEILAQSPGSRKKKKVGLMSKIIYKTLKIIITTTTTTTKLTKATTKTMGKHAVTYQTDPWKYSIEMRETWLPAVQIKARFVYNFCPRIDDIQINVYIYVCVCISWSRFYRLPSIWNGFTRTNVYGREDHYYDHKRPTGAQIVNQIDVDYFVLPLIAVSSFALKLCSDEGIFLSSKNQILECARYPCKNINGKSFELPEIVRQLKRNPQSNRGSSHEDCKKSCFSGQS